MSQSALTYAKFCIVAVAVAGVFGMAMLGKISPTVAVTDVSVVVGALLAALGLSAGGSAVATQIAQAAATTIAPAAPTSPAGVASAAKRAKKE
jgi:hypothetical protein